MKRRNRQRKNRYRTPSAAEQFEVRQVLSAVTVSPDVAAIDGTGNNVENPELGSTHVELLRLAEAEYADGTSAPAGEDRPSAREVSNALAAQDESIGNARNLTDYLWIWGQFLDHDIDLSENADPAEPFNIEVPQGDFYFDPFGTGDAEISLNRTVYVEGDDSSDGLRQQLNEITAFIDGSVVYGSDQERADALRTFEGGLLKTSDGDYLPYNSEGYPNAGGTSDTLYLAGDVRANENVALTSMHTIFVREHNRIATELAEQDPELTDEELYQQARATVRAQIQVITYNEFLPALLGPDALSDYQGYDPNVNPGIANEFSTAAYRFGHSMLSSELQRLDADGNIIEDGNLSLQEAFFNPGEVAEQGIDSILRGAATQAAQELDNQIIDDVRNFLFGPPGAGGLDLASLNIQRGRDHGLVDYNDTRAALGLERVTSFDQITSDPDVALALQETYGSVDNIDLWVGGLAEDHLDGSSMGETFTTIIVDQFERLRDGDRYWYQNVFSGRQLQEIESTTLADIIERNSDVEGLQENVFFLKGTEVLHVDMQDARTDNVIVRSRGDRIEVVDGDRHRIIASRPADEVAGLKITGADHLADTVTIDARLSQAAPDLDIDISGGTGRRVRDTLVIRGTSGNDAMTAVDNAVSVGDLDIVFSDMEILVLEGLDGDDVLDAEDSAAPIIRLRGGRGNDTLIGDQSGDSKRQRGGSRTPMTNDSGGNLFRRRETGRSSGPERRQLQSDAGRRNELPSQQNSEPETDGVSRRRRNSNDSAQQTSNADADRRQNDRAGSLPQPLNQAFDGENPSQTAAGVRRSRRGRR